MCPCGGGVIPPAGETRAAASERESTRALSRLESAELETIGRFYRPDMDTKKGVGRDAREGPSEGAGIPQHGVFASVTVFRGHWRLLPLPADTPAGDDPELDEDELDEDDE